MTDKLFETYRIADRTAPNRFAAQAMEINSSESGGAAGDTVINRYNSLAEGGWGIVFLEATSITDRHLARPNGLVLSRENLDSFKRLVGSFKSINDSSLLIVQLTHSGRLSGEFSRKVKAYEDEENEIPVLTEAELDELPQLYNNAAGLAKEAGFDGVDVKTCHGYLTTELLRPLNRRNDKYGGSVENRARLIASVIKSTTERYPGLIVGTRMSVYEGIRGGCGTSGPDEILEDLEDIRQIASIFAASGAHFFNISAGAPVYNSQLLRPGKKESFYRLSQFRYTKLFKEWFPETAIIGSTYTTGDSSCLLYARENISKGHTDFAGFGRQNLADSHFPVKLRENRDQVRYCTLCGKCSKLLSDDVKVYCAYHYSDNPYSVTRKL